jgi:hypothetical protein
MRFLFSHTNDAAQLVSNPSPDCSQTLRVLIWNPRVDYYWSWPQQFGDSFSQPIHSSFPYNICMKISGSGSGEGTNFCFGHIQDSLNNVGGTSNWVGNCNFHLPMPTPVIFLCHFLHKEKQSPCEPRERERKLATSNLLHAATVGIQQKKCNYIIVRADISPDDMSYGKFSQTPIFLQL